MENFKEVAKGVIDTRLLRSVSFKISGVSSDSRGEQEGKVFVAYDGVDVDGHDFIAQAIDKGAVAVVGEKDLRLPVPHFKVPNGRIAWAMMLANWYGRPDRRLKIVGVTGTDGKTTTVNFIYEILKAAGVRCGMVSTVQAKVGRKTLEMGFHTTTPGPDDLWKFLAQMVKSKEQVAVLEMTSMGLAMDRLGPVRYEVGVLTNLTHDHLEYHQTLGGYREAKAKLFKNSNVSVLNQSDPSFEFFRSKAGGRVVGYHLKTEVRKIVYFKRGGRYFQKFEMKYAGKWVTIETAFLGDYNIENILAASKVAECFSVEVSDLVRGVTALKQVAGRFELIPNKRGVNAVVDFAHTENGIRSVVGLVRKLRKKGGRIIVVFGCNGGRDQTKRPGMGKTAVELADLVVVTSEDPRTEDVEQIFRQIEAGCKQGGGVSGKNYFRVDDRAEAIDFAINKLARRGDWVLTLGKGHERSMCIGRTELPWNEVEIVKEALG